MHLGEPCSLVAQPCNHLKGGVLPIEELKAQLQSIAMKRTGGEKTDEVLGRNGSEPEGIPQSIIVTLDGIEGATPTPVSEPEDLLVADEEEPSQGTEGGGIEPAVPREPEQLTLLTELSGSIFDVGEGQGNASKKKRSRPSKTKTKPKP